MTAAGQGIGATIRRRWLRLPGNARGAVWMVLGTLAFLIGQAIAKSLSPAIHAFELTFFRSAFAFAVLAPVILRTGPLAFRSACLKLHLIRGVVGGVAMLCVFYGITRMPLANVNTLGFTKPLFMIVLAVLFLGEPVRIRRAVATVIGFLGVLIVLRPGIGDFEVAAYVVLAAAGLHSVAHVILKKMAAIDPPVTIASYYMGLTALVTLIPASFVWVWPTGAQLVWLILIGAFTGIGQTFLSLAFRAGDATVIGPFDYARLIWATGFDIALFALVPDLWTSVGALVIVLSTLYIAHRGATVEQAGEGRSRR